MKLLIIAATGMTLLAGCGNKEEPAPAAVPDQPAQPAAAAPATAAQQPTFSARPIPTDPQAALAASETARRAREYEEAAQALLAVQRQQRLTEQQAAAARNQMIQLQADLAAGLASGDPKAKAAAELLRRSSMR